MTDQQTQRQGQMKLGLVHMYMIVLIPQSYHSQNISIFGQHQMIPYMWLCCHPVDWKIMMRKTCVKLFFYYHPHKSGCKDVKNHHNKKEKPLIQYHSSMSHYSLFWTFWQVLTTLSKASHFSWLHFVYCHQRNQHQLPLIHTAMLNTDSGSLYHFQDPKSKKNKKFSIHQNIMERNYKAINLYLTGLDGRYLNQ